MQIFQCKAKWKEREVRSPDIQYVFPHEQEKKTGTIERLSANGDHAWVSTMAILSGELSPVLLASGQAPVV